LGAYCILASEPAFSFHLGSFDLRAFSPLGLQGSDARLLRAYKRLESA
jgi:hypothetical protein